jgi:hypothetical protein
VIADLLTGLGVVVVLALGAALAWPVLRRAWHGGSVRAALLFSRDGRYAVALAERLRAVSARIRRVVRTLEPDPAERETVLAMLDRFTGTELNALLWQMRLVLATGDTERIRELHRKIETDTESWARAGGAERERAAAGLARLRQDLEARRKTGRLWAAMVQGLEQSVQDLAALERELVAAGVTRQQPLSAFRARIAESMENLQRLRAAHDELERG